MDAFADPDLEAPVRPAPAAGAAPRGGAHPFAARPGAAAPLVLGAIALLVLFQGPARSLPSSWWSDPDAGHGLLLAPLSVWLLWKLGIGEDSRPRPGWGLALLTGAVVLRWAGGLAAELLTMRASLFLAGIALIVFFLGFRQLLRWWLPLTLLLLSIPLPQVLIQTLSLPLQLQASEIGAGLLATRHVPVLLSGNVIHLPGHALFVTEACSGLRSLTALVALGVLAGGLWLRLPWTRALLVAVSVPLAVLINGVRIFLTGFVVYFGSPSLGEGFMHYTEGWMLFVVALLFLGAGAWLLGRIELLVGPREAAA